MQQVLDLTGGHGAEAVLDFVGEGGATKEGVAMLRRAGNYFVVGYGENIDVPTIDIISTEINFIGNLVGSYNDLQELMALAAQGKVTCTPPSTRWRNSRGPSTISTRAKSAASCTDPEEGSRGLSTPSWSDRDETGVDGLSARPGVVFLPPVLVPKTEPAGSNWSCSLENPAVYALGRRGSVMAKQAASTSTADTSKKALQDLPQALLLHPTDHQPAVHRCDGLRSETGEVTDQSN